MKIPMELDVLPPSDDYILKALLTHPDAKPALMDLISAVIKREVLDVSIRNNELPTMDSEEKNERLDVNFVIDNNDQVDVEMQGSRIEEIAGGHDNFINKAIYYLTDLHSSQKSKGINYNELVRTYQVTFSMYPVFPYSQDYVTYSSLRCEDGTQISDQINLVIIELNKLNEIIKRPLYEMTELDMWSIFLGYAQDIKQREIINEILDRREALAMAAEVLTSISKDEHERAKYLSRRKFETDMTSNLLTVEARGEARGIAIGVERLAELLKAGMPLEEAVEKAKRSE